MTGRSSLVFAATALALLVPSAASAHHQWELSGAIGAAVSSRLGAGSETERGDVGSPPNPIFLAELGYRTELDGFASLTFTHQDLSLGFKPSNATSETASLAVTRQDLAAGGYLEHTYGRWVPYLGVQLGATRIAASGFSDEYRPLIVLDGGVKYDLTEHFQARLFLRAPMTIYTAHTKILCVSPIGCSEPLNGTPYFQLQAALGITAEF